MWTAKHVNSQAACLLSASPEPTSPPPRARTEQLSTLVLLFPFAAGHLARMEWLRSRHTFGYLLCDFFVLLPVITHHSLMWLFNSHLPVYTDLHVFLYGHEARVSIKIPLWAPGRGCSVSNQRPRLVRVWADARRTRLESRPAYLHRMSPLCPWQR